MAINKRKILESAQKNLQKGLLDKALEDYRTLLKADPHDSNVLLKVGDLYLKQGRRDESINYYVRVAQQFTRDGFDAKAVALYKQISRLDPKRHDICVPLAELYGRMGLVSDAIASLQTAADAAYRSGDKDDALELLRRMAALDPSNTPNRLKVAELLAQESRKEEALTEYQAVAEELERRGEEEERIRVVERILAVDPERASALREVARAKLATSQFAAARKLAERLVAAHPDDVDGMEILGHALLGAGDADGARAVFRDLAERFRQRGDEDRARDLMQRFGGLEALAPDESDPDAALESDAGADDGPLELDAEIGNGEDFVLDEDPFAGRAPQSPVPVGKIETVQALKRAARPAPPPPAPRPAPPKPAVAQAPARGVDFESTDPGQLLAEATVYLRYGKHERAVAALRAVLAREPGNLAALEHLGEALAARGEVAEAVTAWQLATEAAREAGDTQAYGRVRARMVEVDAAAAAAVAPSEAEAPATDTTDDPLLEDVEIEFDLDGGLESEPLELASERGGPAIEVGGGVDADFSDGVDLIDPNEWSPDAAPADEPGARPEPPPPDDSDTAETRADEEPTATTPGQLAEQLEEAEFYLEQGLFEEARGLYESILAAAPNHPQALLRLGEIAAKSGRPIAAPAPPPRVAPPPPAPAALALDEEVEFEIADDEAPSEVFEVRADATQPSFAESPAAPEPAGDFDLAAELSLGIADESGPRTLAGTEEEGFEQVFNAFKSGVERELGEGDYEARYDLGIAYKEMGLLDDAIGEFRIAMQAEARRLSSLHMLGLCALELGRAADAVAHLEQALSLPDLPADQRVPLRYDLGRAYAAQGDVKRARAAFEAVRAEDPAFGDVERELAALPERASTPAPADETEEAYESFDDLLAEGAEAPAPPRYESFDDLFTDAEEEPARAAAREPEPAPVARAAPAEPSPEPEAVPEPSLEPVPEPEPAPEPPGESTAPPAAPGRKRRKISFV